MNSSIKPLKGAFLIISVVHEGISVHWVKMAQTNILHLQFLTRNTLLTFYWFYSHTKQQFSVCQMNNTFFLDWLTFITFWCTHKHFNTFFVLSSLVTSVTHLIGLVSGFHGHSAGDAFCQHNGWMNCQFQINKAVQCSSGHECDCALWDWINPHGSNFLILPSSR